MKSVALVAILPLAAALQLGPAAARAAAARPVLSRATHRTRAVACMSSSERIAELQAEVDQLEADGVGAEALAPLKAEIQALRVADVEAQISALKAQVNKAVEPEPAPAAADEP